MDISDARKHLMNKALEQRRQRRRQLQRKEFSNHHSKPSIEKYDSSVQARDAHHSKILRRSKPWKNQNKKTANNMVIDGSSHIPNPNQRNIQHPGETSNAIKTMSQTTAQQIQSDQRFNSNDTSQNSAEWSDKVIADSCFRGPAGDNEQDENDRVERRRTMNRVRRNIEARKRGNSLHDDSSDSLGTFARKN